MSAKSSVFEGMIDQRCYTYNLRSLSAFVREQFHPLEIEPVAQLPANSV